MKTPPHDNPLPKNLLAGTLAPPEMVEEMVEGRGRLCFIDGGQ